MTTNPYAKKLEKADARVSNILTRSAEDPLWADEKFWQGTWPKLVDNAAELVEKFSEWEIRSLK